MKSVLSLLALALTVATAYPADQKAKALAVAKACCACEDEAHLDPKLTKAAAISVALAVTEVTPTRRERFVLVTSPTCEPCHRMKANEIPELQESVPVVESSGGYGATSFPTIIYEVNGKEKWRTTGYTSAKTLLSLRGS